MKRTHNKYILNCFSYFIKIILFLSITSISFANENKIGSVTEINGTIVAITDELEERDLLIHDPIFLNEEIFATEGSSATIQFDDNTAIIMTELTSINVSEFENSKKNPKLKAELLKGKIIIESGSIAKKNDGVMTVKVTTSSLGLRGTRIEVDLKPDGKSNVSLAADSFGNVGSIDVTSGGQTSNITSTEEVLEISKNNETVSRNKSEDEKEIEKSVSETLIKSSKIDEQEITQQLQKKLEDGKLQDANNDGVVDVSDIEITKNQITNEKKQKIDFIVENSKDDNTEFLSDVINQSDEKNTGEVIENIIEDNDNLVEGVVENLSDKDNKFLTTSTSEGAGLIKEKIFETIVAKETDKSAAILSKVMANSDEATVSSVINNITEKNTNEQSKLSLKVMADFSEKNPEKLETLAQNNTDQIEKLTISAVEEAQSSEEDADLIAKVVAVASDELANKVVEEVSKNSTEVKQTLSAKVLKAIVDSNSGKIDIINDEVKDTMIKQTIVSAQNQQEGTGVQQDQDMTSIVSDIIVNTNTETGSKIIEELNNSSTNTENDISLKVISAISEKDTTKLNTLSENNKEQIETLAETAIKNADASNESADLIAKVVANASNELVNKMVGEVSKNSIDENQALSAKVMKSIVETNPEKIKTLSDKNKETMISQTIEAAKNQAEGTSTDEIDLSNTIAEIVTKSDTATAAEVLESLEEVSSESESKLSLNVVSNLTKQKNYEEKIEILSVTSSEVDKSINNLVEKAVENIASEQDLELVTDIVENSKGTVADKIIDTANKSEESKKKITEVIVNVIEKNPEKAVEIIEKNKNTNTILETVKTKIENNEAVTTDDFEEVFDTNVSPN
ncbi:FecR domain-containing protein [Pelagibacterales bacterium SAG-MED48]|nr:FecR domain-containing protein [Pelagibacterales bacterium SAG-MED48]